MLKIAFVSCGHVHIVSVSLRAAREVVFEVNGKLERAHVMQISSGEVLF